MDNINKIESLPEESDIELIHESWGNILTKRNDSYYLLSVDIFLNDLDDSGPEKGQDAVDKFLKWRFTDYPEYMIEVTEEEAKVLEKEMWYDRSKDQPLLDEKNRIIEEQVKKVKRESEREKERIELRNAFMEYLNKNRAEK